MHTHQPLVAPDYAGDGFGFYTPIEVDDEVVVVAPSGDPAEGLVVARRLWSAADPPPQEAIDHPADVLLHVKAGASIRIVVSDGGKILLGGPDSSEPLPLGNVLVQALKELVTGGVLTSPDGPVFAQGSWVAKYLNSDSTNILSKKAMTERGE